MRLRLLYQSPYCIAASQPELLVLAIGLVMEFLRLMVLGNFELPFQGVGLEVAVSGSGCPELNYELSRVVCLYRSVGEPFWY